MSYAPVCGGPLTYFSPCHAGCSNLTKTSKAGSISYSNCACVAGPGEAKKGNCLVNCRFKFVLFLSVTSLIVFLTFLNDTPATIVTLRSAPEGQRSYALGHQMNLVRLLGAIPGPIVYGALLDSTCILWSSKCGEKGYCLEYDHTGMAKVVLGVSLTCKTITMICFGLSWLFCRRTDGKEKTRKEVEFKEVNKDDSPCSFETGM